MGSRPLPHEGTEGAYGIPAAKPEEAGLKEENPMLNIRKVYGKDGFLILTKLSKVERETVILFNEVEVEAGIYTHNAGLRKKRLAAFSEQYPDLCRLERKYLHGVASYLLDKSHLSIRLLPTCREERREKMSENVRKNGFTGKTE